MTQEARASTNLAAAKKQPVDEKKKTLFTTIFEMDLFAPNKDVNDYGSRKKKNVSYTVASKIWVYLIYVDTLHKHEKYVMNSTKWIVV